MRSYFEISLIAEQREAEVDLVVGKEGCIAPLDGKGLGGKLGMTGGAERLEYIRRPPAGEWTPEGLDPAAALDIPDDAGAAAVIKAFGPSASAQAALL